MTPATKQVYREDSVFMLTDILKGTMTSPYGTSYNAYLLTGEKNVLVETVHVKPNLNNYKELLKLAKKYKRSKFAAMTRGVKWLR